MSVQKVQYADDLNDDSQEGRHKGGRGTWLLILLAVDSITCLTLFFMAGKNNEKQFLEHEIHAGSTARWEEDVLDLVALSAVRTASLAFLFYRIGIAKLGGYDEEGVLSKSETTTVSNFFTHFVSVVSLAYCATRLGIAIDLKRHLDGGDLGFALLVASTSFSLFEFFASMWQRSNRISQTKHQGLSINGDTDEEANPKKNKKGRASLKRLMKLARPEYGLIAAGMGMLVITSASSTAAPFFFGKVIDAATKNDRSSLNRHIFILGIIYVVGAVASFFRSWFFTLAGQRLVARVRSKVFKSIISQEVAFFDVTRTGELTNRLASDTAVIQNACTVNLSMLARYTAQILGSIAIMAGVSWKLTLVLLSVVPAVAIGAVSYGRKVKDIRKKFQDRLADASTTAEENIGSIRTVKTFSNEPRAEKEYNESVHASYIQGARLALVQGGFAGIIQLLATSALLLVLWYGGTLVVKGELTAGVLTSFMLYSLSVAMAFAFLSSLYGDFMQALGASIRIFELMDRSPKIVDGKKKDDAFNSSPEFDSSIELKDVNFRYPSRDDTPVLTNVSLKVPKGKVVALVGPSGGGKSTIVSLIERLYDPDSGSVNLGGVDIKDLDLEWYHHKMAIVSQEPTLFACSIRDNVAYARPNASDEEVEAACKQANAHTFILNFEDGYETMVGERGVRLSGGQKQRVAIARALLCNPEILLLDEATSALDADSEHLVQEAIERAMENRTVIVIAHRLSTVMNANTVVVIEKGEVRESGTHQELLEHGGIYAKLVARQLLGGSDGTHSGGESTPVN